MAGRPTQSSSSSGIFFQGDGESQGLINYSHLSYSLGNSTNSGIVTGPGFHNLSMVSGDMNNPIMNSIPTSGPSVGASSLVTDANSGLNGGPQLQRSTSINTESYMRLPTSPLSFSSNNISISGSSAVDCSTAVQQSSQHNPSVQQGGSSPTSLPTSQNGRSAHPVGPRAPETFFQDPNNLTRVHKKPRLDMKQDDVLHQQVLRQWLQRQDMSQPQQGPNPQYQVLLHQHRLRQQQQFLQSLPPLQRVQLQQQQQQQQQQLQMRQQLQQQGMQLQQLPSVARPNENSVCARRLMQYLYHHRQRSSDNSIVYWKKFVTEYYSPRAKKRWCLSLYENVGHQALGVFTQASMDAWQCDLCGAKSGRGFEAAFEVLPRLNEIKFASGVLDEILYLDLPFERRTASGLMVLDYKKAVQESVYEHIRVVRVGHLRIIFSQELKILSWEFCAHGHEEFLPSRFLGPQVNQVLQIGQKCQNSLSESGSNGALQQEDLLANGNMLVAAGCHLKRSLEPPSLNDLGFSKRYVRCLQISEVVTSMRDLIAFSRDQKVGPIEALKNYPRHMSSTNARGFPMDRNSLNQVMALQNPGINIPVNSNSHNNHMAARNVPGQASFALTNYQTMFTRQNSMNSNPSGAVQQVQPLPSSSLVNANPSPSSSFQGHCGLLTGSMQNPSNNDLPSSSHPSAHQQASGAGSSSLQANQQSSINANQDLDQQMIHQLLQQMSNDKSSNSGAGQQQQRLSGQVAINTGGSGTGRVGQSPLSSAQNPTSSNSFRVASNNNESSPVVDSNNGLGFRMEHQGQNPSSLEGMMSQEFSTNEFLNSDLDDNNIGYHWK